MGKQRKQHPVALCRSRVWYTFSVYVQLTHTHFMFRPNWSFAVIQIGIALQVFIRQLLVRGFFRTVCPADTLFFGFYLQLLAIKFASVV
jgi:hypothetical protein